MEKWKKCVICSRRTDRMSRNAWRWFNEANTSIICHKHIISAERNGQDDPRPNETQENEHEIVDYQEMDFGQHGDEDMELNQNEDSQENEKQSEFEFSVNYDNDHDNTSFIDEREYFNSDESELDEHSNEETSQSDSTSESDYQNEEQEQEILLNFKRLPFSKAQCFICKKKFDKETRSKTISIDGIVSILKKRQILIKIGSRCCPHHLNLKRCIKPAFLDNLEANIETVNMKKSEIESILSNIDSKDVTLFEKFLDTTSISEHLCKKITGLDLEHFEIIKKVIEDSQSMRNSSNRSISQALAVYLFW